MLGDLLAKASPARMLLMSRYIDYLTFGLRLSGVPEPTFERLFAKPKPHVKVSNGLSQ